MVSTARKVRSVVLTLDAWGALDEDVAGELVDGALVEEEMPTYLHETVVTFLSRFFDDWLSPRGGFVFGSEAKLATGARRGRKPDLSVYFPGARLPRPRDSVSRVPPTVVVEVVTGTPRDGRRDRIEKRAEYAASKVAWYWIVDPQLRTIEVLRLVRGRYTDALGVSDGVHAVPGLPGLSIDVDALWARIDALESARR